MALISSASLGRRERGQRPAGGDGGLLQQADADRRHLRRLAQKVRQRLLAAHARESRRQRSRVEVGPQRDHQRCLPQPKHRLAQLRRQRIDGAALDTAARDRGFAAHRMRTDCQRHALERLSLETIAEDVGPCDREAGIGRPQRRDGNAFGRKEARPRSHPSRAAASLHRQARVRSRRQRRTRPHLALETAAALLRPIRSSDDETQTERLRHRGAATRRAARAKP